MSWICKIKGHYLQRMAGGPPRNAPEGWTHSLYCLRCGRSIQFVDAPSLVGRDPVELQPEPRLHSKEGSGEPK